MSVRGNAGKRRVFFSHSAGTFCAAGALLLGLALTAGLSPQLFWEELPTGRSPLSGKRTLALGGIFLVSELLVFLRIRLSDRARRAWSYVFLLAAPFCAFTAVELINGTNYPLWFRPETLRPQKLLAHYLCCLLLFLLAYALLRSVFAAVAAGGTVFLLFGIANYFVVQFRGSPILPWDLTTLNTAADVIGSYQLKLTGRMGLFLFLFVCFLCLIFSVCGARPIPAGKAWSLSERGASLAGAAALAVLIIPCNLLASLDIVVIPWRQLSSMKINGVVTGFLANVQYLRVEKPEGYSREAAEELAAQTGNRDAEPLENPEKEPVILAVMNESLADFTQIGEVEYTEDPLACLHGLEDSGEVIWGSAYAPVFGAGTCNSEYEFLTGNSAAFLPAGCRAYQQYVTSPQPSLASALGELGYARVAVHPGDRGAWDRDKAYPNLGFEKFVDGASFDVERNLVRGYTDDRTNYEQVIWEYEHRDKSRNLFLLNVTIQNHGGYASAEYETAVRLKYEPGKYPLAEQYLTLVRDSDRAFEELVSYFSQADEPVVILMFGDHWPKLEDDFVSLLLGADSSGLSLEDTMRTYEVPFVIWANYPLEGMEVRGTSLNYLSGLLLRAAGLPQTGYQNFLEALEKDLPAVSGLGFTDGVRFYGTGEESPYDGLLRGYQILQYNHMFGGKDRLEPFFSFSS